MLFLISGCYIISPINAETTRIPGIAAGNWAKYNVTFNYFTNDPNPPMITPPLGEIEYFMLEVQSVANTNVTYQTIMHFKNGTEMLLLSWIDVSSGQTDYGLTSFGTIIAANLTAGDKIYLNSLSATINASTVGTYAGDQREVNWFGMTQNLTYPYSQQTQFVDYSIFWDKMSGIFVSIDESIAYIDTAKEYTTNMTIALIITETNIWKPLPTIAAKVFIVPRFINLKSNGKWLLAFIELPKGYKAKNVNLSTIMMNGTVPLEGKAMIIGKRWLLVKFDRSEVISLILSNTHSKTKFMTVTLTISGKLSDGSMFQGSDKVVAIFPRLRHWKQHPFCSPI
jgi:hypothetical protein